MSPTKSGRGSSWPTMALLRRLSILLLAASTLPRSTSQTPSSLPKSSDFDDACLDTANGQRELNFTAEFRSRAATNESDSAAAAAGESSDRTAARRSAAATLGLAGPVADCRCSFDAVDRANLEEIHPLLERVVATPFFAHFKVDLCSECRLWDDAPMCVLRDCGVCECERPPEWAAAVDWMPPEAAASSSGSDGGGDEGGCGHVDDRVATMVDPRAAEGWSAPPAAAAAAAAAPFLGGPAPTGPAGGGDAAVVVDLRLNPERYTGYAGRSAEKVWTAIHRDNCFPEEDGDDGHDGACDLTTDQRIYNRIVSGLHSSISLHIAHSYCLEMDPGRIAECKTWGPNAAAARERVLGHPDRVENLYAAFAVMLRAVQMAGPAITAAVPAEDPFFADSLSEWKERLQPEILRAFDSCPPTFDETALFADVADAADAAARRRELRRRFRHLLRIMECVGCDRCKLWGTLQTLGVGTALRIVLEGDASSSVDLSRQEAVALVHTLERFSSALVYAHDLQEAGGNSETPSWMA